MGFPQRLQAAPTGLINHRGRTPDKARIRVGICRLSDFLILLKFLAMQQIRIFEEVKAYRNSQATLRVEIAMLLSVIAGHRRIWQRGYYITVASPVHRTPTAGRGGVASRIRAIQ